MIVTIILLVILGVIFSGLWTDYLWYRSIHFASVYTTQIWTKIALFVIGGLIIALAVSLNVYLAFRMRPPFRPIGGEQVLERYRAAIDPYRRLVLIVLTILLLLFNGSSASGMWREWLLFTHRTSFGVKDPQFHMDVSFFTFTYPMLRGILSLAFTAIVLAFIAAAITHYLYGGIRLQAPKGSRVSPGAWAHMSVLLGIFVLLKAVAYYLDRYGLAFSDRGKVAGPSFTDVNAVLPAKTILMIIAVICAVLFFGNVFRRGGMLPGVGLGLLVLSAILIGGVYPALIQQFQVKPNEADKEAPYIQRNIAATRNAYNVGNTAIGEYNATKQPTVSQLSQEASTIPSVRLLDPNVVSPTFQQNQQIRSFYSFPDSLYIDRYPLGTNQATLDMVVSARELSGPPPQQNNWINEHLVYTHGFGFVAARGNETASNGTPDYVEKNIPPTGALGQYEPRVYFGAETNNYVIVGGPKGGRNREFDYPDDSTTGSGQKNNTYTGKDGVSIGSFFNRLLYAVQFRDRNILLSGAINDKSKILYNRTPRDRVQKAAPFLDVDGNAYPAIVNKRMVWVLDGYTTSNGYPYSQPINFGAATRDTNTETSGRIVQQSGKQINYIRNSVKATVDAYDGTVHLYQWDKTDPVLKTWMKIFPHTVEPKSKITSNVDLMKHVRYPEDLFKVQRSILAQYHVGDAQSFYGGQDFWQIPDDPTKGDQAPEPPYRVTLKMPKIPGDKNMPGDDTPTFSLTSTFVPRGRENLAAYMQVDSSPDSPDYGKIRILELPRNQAFNGPGQVQNSFETEFRNQLFPLRQQGVKAEMGNLLTLPFGDGLLYVEPVYSSTASGPGSFPVLRYVMVQFGDRGGIGSNLQEALNQVFNTTGNDNTGNTPPTKNGGKLTVNADVVKYLNDASNAYNDSQDALKKGDFKAYGDAQKRLKKALDNASAAANKPKS
ncbi:MAG TPA: UPF0182 family protein [Streptosporangiaceae bacterium]